MCLDDEGVKEVLAEVSKPVKTYGVSDEADVRAIDIEQDGMQTRFTVIREGHAPMPVTLNMPGWHNMLNALAAITVATSLNINDRAIRTSLEEFKGIGRRFQLNGEVDLPVGKITLVDDYGHHPRELAATLEALQQAWPERRKVVVFQPHRYTRTRDLFEDFVEVLSSVDVLVLLDVYPAGEEPVTGADGKALSQAIRVRGQVNPVFVGKQADLPQILAGLVQGDDVVLTMGAGNVGQIAAELPQQLQEALNHAG